MTLRPSYVWAVSAALLLGGFITAAQAQDPPSARAEPAAVEQPEEPAKSITVYPVWIVPKAEQTAEFRRHIADVVRLLLERAGLETIEMGQPEFVPPETDDAAALAAAFGKFVVEHPIETEYAFFGQIHGTPKTGVKSIETALVTKQGTVILADRDDPKTFRKTSDMKPKNPMTCSIFLARKVQRLWKLANPLRNNAPKGKMADLWREKSSLPPQGELDAMKGRLEAMKQDIKNSKVTVYPVRVRGKGDGPCAVELTAMLNEQALCQAVHTDADPNLDIKGNYNEQKVLWDTARAFQQYVKKHEPATPYALFADYGIGRGTDGEVKVGGVHFIVCNRAGDWVIVDFQNSHQPDFKSIQPKSEEDCNRLVVKRLKRILKL